MNQKFLKFPVAKPQRRKGIPLFFAPLLFCGVSQAQSADELLNAVRQSESKIQLRATQITQSGNSREVATLYRSGLKRRLEWSAPGIKAGDFLVDDGQTVTLFHRADKTAIQTQSSRRGPVLAPGNWNVGPIIKQDGRSVRVLKRSSGREITVDAQTNAILRTKGAGGVTSLQNVQYGAVPAAKFQFSAPAGGRVVRAEGRLFGDLNAARRFATWLQTPSQVPDGYVFESVIAGKNEVWLRYSNGKKRFSIFQQKTGDADLAPQKVDGGWFWRKNGLRFVSTGAPDDAIQLLSR